MVKLFHRYGLILILLAVLAGALIFSLNGAAAKGKSPAVFINSAASAIVPVESGGSLFLPLNFPLEEGKSTWTVTLDYNKEKGTVNVQKSLAKEKLRGDTKCSRCGGSGKCQSCYPAGSGKSINDGVCNGCDGNGKCFYCNGAGSY
ncbi:MAG: hypothetical protein RDV48_17215 [Candidatus Eremiobacteraeota bacterium]|nr:hypothetical protein [Candidatus Eremiobacteraeota bacterium]